jgi:hypothetical protein
MNKAQMSAIKCAYNDLVGSLQSYNLLDIEAHDWKAHLLTIVELEEAFDFIEKQETEEVV